ncbi:MAG TPA: guanylate kinase [Phototrophicaceae bacterium]|jgi:guanylate kinase|nr:guanylate kinase [Phototrophicaceae bacterium]
MPMGSMEEQLQGLLFVLVGPGGVGKNTLMQMVLPRFDRLRQLPTATTRTPRSGEQQGREHLFIGVDEFRRMIADGELIEHEEVHPGKFYGVPRKVVEQTLATGEDLIADIEIAGAKKVHEAFPHNTVLIFIAPPSLDVLEERMENRGETEAGIAERLARAEREMHFKDCCDYVIVNENLESASRLLYDVIASTRKQRDEHPGVRLISQV